MCEATLQVNLWVWVLLGVGIGMVIQCTIFWMVRRMTAGATARWIDLGEVPGS